MDQSWNSEPDGFTKSETTTFIKRAGYSFKDSINTQMFQVFSSWSVAWNPFWFRNDSSSSRNELTEMFQKDLKMGQFHRKRGGIEADGSLILKRSN